MLFHYRYKWLHVCYQDLLGFCIFKVLLQLFQGRPFYSSWSPHGKTLAVTQVLCQISSPLSLGWIVKLGQAVSFNSMAGGADILAEQISPPCHPAGLHPGEKGTGPAVGRPWKWRLLNPVGQARILHKNMGAWGWYFLCTIVLLCFLNSEIITLKWCFSPHIFQKILLLEVGFLDLAKHETAEGAQCFLKRYWQALKCAASPCMDIPFQTDMLTVTGRSPVLLLNRCTKCVHLH